MKKNALIWRAFAGVICLSLLLAACYSPGESGPRTDPGTQQPEVQAASPTPDAPVVQPPVETPATSPMPEMVTEAAPTGAPTPELTPEPSPEPTPTPLPLAGIEMHSVSAGGGLEQAQQANNYWIRRNALLWESVEPQEGVRRWESLARLEQEMIAASERGMEMILIVRATPWWARQRPGSQCSAVTQEKFAAFARFMHDAVARYSVPPYNVKYWELGNEPDVDPRLVPWDSVYGCWGDARAEDYGGGHYAEMLKVVYPQIKAANPEAWVLTGGLLLHCDPTNPPETSPGSGQKAECQTGKYLEALLANGGGDFIDGISFHAYDYYTGVKGQYGYSVWYSSSETTGPLLITKTRYIRNLLNRYGHPDLPLFNTEVALLCGHSGNEGVCQTEDFNLSKAYFAAQANAAARAEGLYANVWYSITGWRASGLVNAGLQPLPVYDAFRFSARILNTSSFVAQITQFPGVMGYEFQRGSERFWILWSMDREEHTIQLPSLPTAMYDVNGGPIDPAQEFILDMAPVYLVWNSSN